MKSNRIFVIFIFGAAIGLLVAVLLTRDSHQIAGVDPSAPETKFVENGSKASWSPDGRSIMFSEQGGRGLQVMDLQTRTRQALQVDGKDPVWSPSGTLIACVRRGSYGTTDTYLSEEVWLVPVKDGAARRLIRGGFPSWSADGRTLYVHSRASNQILALDAGNLDAPPTVFYDKTPSWYYTTSPDGRQVAFGSRNQLEIRDRETGAVTRQWPTPGNRGLLPAWSPDGELVAFGGFNDSRLGMWILEVRTGQAVPVKEGQFTMPAWSVGGHWLAFDERVGRTNSVWLVGRPYLDQLLRSATTANPPPRQ